MTDTCSVCIEPFSKLLRFEIECFNCDFKACRKCIRYYILNSSNNIVCCMNCKVTWNDKFISTVLLKAFFKKQYREHIDKNSVQEQLSLLPNTQPDVELIKLKEALKKEKSELVIVFTKLYDDLLVIEKELMVKHIIILEDDIQNNIKIDYDKELLKPFKERIKKSVIVKKYHKSKLVLKAEAEFNVLNEIKSNLIYIERQTIFNKIKDINKIINSSRVNKDKVLYNRPCSNEHCNGMLKYGNDLCGICDHITCSKCLESYTKNTEHLCDDDKVKTAQLIKKDTKYCPKCNFGITKLSGCDVMFCTQCTTSFNWKTMEILTKNLHNPHYVEYLRRNGTMRERENLANNCVANPTIGDFDTRRFSNIRNFTEIVKIFNPYKTVIQRGLYIIQYILHIGDEINELRNKIRKYEESNRTARINLLLSRITREEFDPIVSKNSYEIRFFTQRHQIFSTIFDVATELIFNLSNNEMMAINNSILNILEHSTETNNFNKIANHTEEFFNNYISLVTFNEVSIKLNDIIKKITNIAKYCILEDKELSILYGKSSSYMLHLYIR